MQFHGGVYRSDDGAESWAEIGSGLAVFHPKGGLVRKLMEEILVLDASNADAKMAGRAGRQAHIVAENIRKLMNGDPNLTAYEPIGPAIIVPIGPKLGSGQLPNQPDLATREMVSAVKGQDLMVDRYAEILGVPKT